MIDKSKIVDDKTNLKYGNLPDSIKQIYIERETQLTDIIQNTPDNIKGGKDNWQNLFKIKVIRGELGDVIGWVKIWQ
jgi:hypothetical protein